MLLGALQITIEDRAQRDIPLEDYANGERDSDMFALGSIDKVPIVMLAGSDDTTCTNLNARRLLNQFGATQKSLRTVQGAGHFFWGWATGDRFISELIASIEGTDTSDFEAMSGGEVISSLWDRYASEYGGTVLTLILLAIAIVTIGLCVGCCCLCATCCACCTCCRACLRRGKSGDSYQRAPEF